MSKLRNETYDLMKGIALMLMMIAHLALSPDSMANRIIYSFHMPLFFILAGVFAKEIALIPSFKQYSIKNSRRLLLPYMVTMLMLCAWGGLQAYLKGDISYLMLQILRTILASPDGWHTQWGLVYAGPMWFLIALFWVREIFYGIQYICKNIGKYKDESILAICILLSFLSTLIDPHLPSLPFCIMQAFTAIAFYAIGYYVHRHPQPWWVYTICVLVWPLAIVYGGIELSGCGLKYYPLSFIGACGGTCVMYILCKSYSRVLTMIRSAFNNEPKLTPLIWCGIHSLPILCMHEFEMFSAIMYSITLRLPIDYERIWGG